MKYYHKNNQRGVTLIEILVSFTIFVIVLTAVLGSVLSIISANRKAQATKSVVNNLNAAIETMTRTIRTGDTYRCLQNGGSLSSEQTKVKNCNLSISGAGEILMFEGSEGDRTVDNDQIVYLFNDTDFSIERSTDSGNNFLRMTAPEVKVTSLQFFVNGTGRTPGNIEQPFVTMLISGTAGAGEETTSFDIQTTITQRVLDI